MDALLVEGKGNGQKGGKEGGQILGMTCATPQNRNDLKKHTRIFAEACGLWEGQRLEHSALHNDAAERAEQYLTNSWSNI